MHASELLLISRGEKAAVSEKGCGSFDADTYPDPSRDFAPGTRPWGGVGPQCRRVEEGGPSGYDGGAGGRGEPVEKIHGAGRQRRPQQQDTLKVVDDAPRVGSQASRRKVRERVRESPLRSKASEGAREPLRWKMQLKKRPHRHPRHPSQDPSDNTKAVDKAPAACGSTIRRQSDPTLTSGS